MNYCWISEYYKMGNKNQDSDNENGYENGKGDDEVCYEWFAI